VQTRDALVASVEDHRGLMGGWNRVWAEDMAEPAEKPADLQIREATNEDAQRALKWYSRARDLLSLSREGSQPVVSLLREGP